MWHRRHHFLPDEFTFIECMATAERSNLCIKIIEHAFLGYIWYKKKKKKKHVIWFLGMLQVLHHNVN